jgi:hypothetical protein
MNGELSRRAVLGGAVAGLAGALLTRIPVLAATPPATSSARTARVGGTLNLQAFTSGTTYSQAVEMWNRTTGTQLRCWKIYYQLGQFGTSNENAVQTMIDMGIQALISVKPAITPSRTDRDAMVALLKGFHGRGLRAQVCLWQEVGPKDMSADAYHAYVRYYGPSIRQYYPLVFDAPGSKGPDGWRAYDPGRSNLDGYAVDYYCTSFVRNSFRLDTLTDLAGPLPIGVWEIGGAGPGTLTPTTAQINAYMTYLQNFLTQRQASGLPVGSVAWFNGPHQGSNRNEIVGTDPNPEAATDIAAYQLLYKAVNRVS